MKNLITWHGEVLNWLVSVSALEVLWAIAAFLFVFILPGLCCRIYLRKLFPAVEAYCPALLFCYLLSFALSLIISLSLARFYQLTAISIALSFSVVNLVFIMGSISIKDRALSNRNVPPNHIHPLLILTVILIVLFHCYEIYLTPAVRGGFFYFSEIKHIVAHGGLPAQVTHFGIKAEPQIDKLGFVFGTVPYWLLGPPNPLLIHRIGYIFTIAIEATCALFFFLQFLNIPLASCSALLVLANVYFGSTTTYRSFFIPEGTAVLFFLLGAALYIRSISLKQNIVLSALALALCALCHLEISIIAILFCAALSIFLSASLRSLWPARNLLVLLFVSASIFFFIYLLLGRVPDFALSQLQGEQYQSFNGHDPTWEFFHLGDSHLPFNNIASSTLRDLLIAALNVQGYAFRMVVPTVIIMFLALSFTILSFRRIFRQSQSDSETGESYRTALSLAAACTIIGLFGAAIFSDQMFSVWIYRTEVLRRLVPYTALFILILLGSGIMLIIDQFNRCARPITAMVIIVAIVLYGASASLHLPFHDTYPITEDGLAALSWIHAHRHAPTDVVLANVASSGAIHVIADAQGLLEGHQPVLRPQMLVNVLDLLSAAQRYYIAPMKHKEFLLTHNVRFVLRVEMPRTDLGGMLLLPKNKSLASTEEFLADNTLCLRARFRSIQLFEICDAVESS